MSEYEEGYGEGYGEEGYGEEGTEGYGEEEGYGEGSGEGYGEGYEGDRSGYGEGYATDDPSTWDRYAASDMGRMEDPSQKRLRDPRSVSLDVAKGILYDPDYQKFDKIYKDKAYKIIEDLPDRRMLMYNINVLTPSSLFIATYGKDGINKENLKKFLKDTNKLPDVNHLDFIRYVRVLAG